MSDYGAAPLGLGITEKLATFIAEMRLEALPQAAVQAARRGVIDYLGCALAGSKQAPTLKLAQVLRATSQSTQCRVLGTSFRLSVLEAPLLQGMMGHVLDYDDTHMQGVVLHASSPILSALLALAETRATRGGELITAYTAGFEAAVRIGQASPGHHNGGWHLTGTLGTLGAAAAAAKLLGLSPKQVAYALGIAGSQAAGMQQNRGTMTKSFHAGKAAANGVLAALLAAEDFTSSLEIVEGKRGFSRIYSDVARPDAILEHLGERWEITRNGFKPYACGVVLHPLIDGAIELARSHAVPSAVVERIEAEVNAKMVTVTGIEAPRSGLESKFSLYHCAAVAYLDRAAGVAQFSDERATANDVIALRRKVKVRIDDTLAVDQARVRLVAAGKTHEVFIEHATGTKDNPMSDSALQAKFEANASEVLSNASLDAALKSAQELEKVESVRDELTAHCVVS